MKKIALLFAAALAVRAQNPVTASFPSSVANMALAANNATTTLNGSITNSTLTITATNTSKFVTPIEVFIDSEAILVCSKTSTTFTVCANGRGADGTTAASHNNLATIYNNLGAYYANQPAAEISAIETRDLNYTFMSDWTAAAGSVCDAAMNPSTFLWTGTANDTAWTNLRAYNTARSSAGSTYVQGNHNQYCGFLHTVVQDPGMTVDFQGSRTQGIVALNGASLSTYTDSNGGVQTCLLQMGTGTQSQYGQRLINLQVDGGGQAQTDICVASTQEGTVIQNVLVSGILLYGVDQYTNFTTINFSGVFDCVFYKFHFLANGTATTGIRAFAAYRSEYARNTFSFFNNEGDIGLDFEGGSAIFVHSIHCEEIAYCVKLDNGALGHIADITDTNVDSIGADIYLGYSVGQQPAGAVIENALVQVGVRDYSCKNGMLTKGNFYISHYVCDPGNTGSGTLPTNGYTFSSVQVNSVSNPPDFTWTTNNSTISQKGDIYTDRVMNSQTLLGYLGAQSYIAFGYNSGYTDLYYGRIDGPSNSHNGDIVGGDQGYTFMNSATAGYRGSAYRPGCGVNIMTNQNGTVNAGGINIGAGGVLPTLSPCVGGTAASGLHNYGDGTMHFWAKKNLSGSFVTPSDIILLNPDNAAGGLGSAGTFQMGVVSFSSLPTCAVQLQGARRTINDSTTSTFNAVVTGGGTNIGDAYCDGSNWRFH